MSVLSAADFPAVRAVLDVSLDTATLPDATLSQPVYLQAAEAELLALDPLVATRVGTEGERVKRAGIYLLAARVAPAIPRLTGEGFEDYRYQTEAMDWERRADHLRALARAEIALLLAQAATDRRPTIFTVATGDRGT